MQIPAFVGAKIPPHLTFEERVFYYVFWITEYPYSTVHFKFTGNRGFLSERHIHL